MAERALEEQIYPRNLLMAIIDETEWEAPIITDDIHARIEYVVSTLENREREVVLQYFKVGRNCSPIGENFGVSSSRVQQIIDNACKKIRSTSRIDYALYGIAGYVTKVYFGECQKGFAAGFSAGYRAGEKGKRWYMGDNLKLSIRALDLSAHTQLPAPGWIKNNS